MKIALVIERMDKSRGGRETSTAQIASCLAAAGCDVTILCRSGSWQGDNVTVRELPSKSMSRTGRLAEFVGNVQKLHHCYDVVHAMLPVPGADVYQLRGGTIPAQMLASLRRRKFPSKLITAITAPLNFRRRLGLRFERRVMADDNVTVLAVSEMVALQIAEYYSPARQVEVIFNGVDVPDPLCPQRADWRRDARLQIGATDDEAVFVTAATNFALKAVDQVIESFARWSDCREGCPGGKLVVVGGGLSGKYRQLARKFGVDGSVAFVGLTDEIFRWYAAADVCILLSWHDPCSRVVLEATRWGVPSITTAFNGAGEALSDGAGIVVAGPDDVGAIIDAMDILSDADRRRKFSEACMAVSDKLSMDRHVEELLKVYERIVKEKNNFNH